MCDTKPFHNLLICFKFVFLHIKSNQGGEILLWWQRRCEKNKLFFYFILRIYKRNK